MVREHISYKNLIFQESEKLIQDSHAAPAQHQNLLTARGSLLAHAYPMLSPCVNVFMSYRAHRQNERMTDRQTDRQNDRTPQSHNSRVTTTNVFDGRCAKSIPDSSKSIIYFHYHHSDYSYSPMNHCLSYLAEAQKTVCKRSIAHLDCKKLV